MAFSNFNLFLPFLLGGLSAVAIVALHFLRVHPVEKHVATVLFWEQSGKSQHASLWRGRFRRWRLFVFLLTICFVLSLSTFRSWPTYSQTRIFVIDTGYSMSALDSNGKSRLDNAVHLAFDSLSRAGNPMLISAGSQPRLLTDDDRSPLITMKRLRELKSNDQPSDYTSALLLAGSILPSKGGEIIWYTDRREIPAAIPNSIAARIQLKHIGGTSPNAAILATAFESDESDLTHGNLHVRVGTCGMAVTKLTIRNKDSGVAMSQSVLGEGLTDAYFRSLPADGSSWEIKVNDGVGPQPDNLVNFRVPKYLLIRVAFEGKIPSSLRAAMLAMGQVAELKDANVLVSDTAISPRVKIACAIQVVSIGDETVVAGTPISIANGNVSLKGLNLEKACAGKGVSVATLHLTPLLFAGSQCVAGEMIAEGRTTLLISNALLSSDSELPQRSAFPAILLRVCMSMVRSEKATPCVDARRLIDDPAWVEVNSSKNQYATAYSMAETNVMPLLASDGLQDSDKAGAMQSLIVPWGEVMLLCGLILVVIEAVLLATKRIV